MVGILGANKFMEVGVFPECWEQRYFCVMIIRKGGLGWFQAMKRKLMCPNACFSLWDSLHRKEFPAA